VDELTLKPILTAFAAFCSEMYITTNDKNTIYKLAFMLDDLYVNDPIDASLREILQSWHDRYRDAGNYKLAGQKALVLAEKLYGKGMEEYGAEVMEKIRDINGVTKRFIPEEGGLRIQRRESPVTRIEAVIDGQETVTLALLEDMGKAVELLYRRRMVRNSAAAAYDLIINFFEKGKGEINGVPVVNLIGAFTLDAAGMTTTFSHVLFKEVPAVYGSTFTMLRSAILGIFFISTKNMDDAEIARQVNKELGRLDDRMGRFLPDKAYADGINLDPGSYGITVNYYNGGTLLRSERHENVRVEAGRLNLIESFFLANSPEQTGADMRNF
jgi:hypothetical protein